MKDPVFSRTSRRVWLRHAGLGLMLPAGLPSAGCAAPATAGSLPGFGRAKSVLLLYLNGGQSHLDTFDPKPNAPSEVRGDFRTIATSVPGTRICEYLPLCARLADRSHVG